MTSLRYKDMESKESPATEIEEVFIIPLEGLVKHVTRTSNDAKYCLKEVRPNKILSLDNQNLAMT